MNILLFLLLTLLPRTSKKFVNELLREQLVTALTQNGTTTGKVFQYVLSIFLDLLQYFREDLKVS